MSQPGCPSISTAEKPTRHVSVQDWFKNIQELRQVADSKRQDASILRNETRLARNEAEIASTWSRYHSNSRLSDRIAEVKKWFMLLDNVNTTLQEEASLLLEEKAIAELEIEAYYRALGVVSDCLLTRDRRTQTDLCYDEPDKQLKLELNLLETGKKLLTDECEEAMDLLCKIKDLSSKLTNNISDKRSAMEIDSTALNLDKESALTSFKPDVLRIHNEIIAHETWVQEAQCQQTEAETLSAFSIKLRETIRLARDRNKMDYLAQVESTNYALRKRLHDANRQKNELEWQRKNTIEEITRVSEEADRLRQCRSEHVSQLQCAETRQENRNLRPGPEIARDDAQNFLLEEISLLRQLVQDLTNKLESVTNTHNQLESLLIKLESELSCKALCIQMDVRTLDLRCNLVEHLPVAKMDKDIVLVKMQKQIAPQQAPITTEM